MPCPRRLQHRIAPHPLPGSLTIERGCGADYRALAPFHYLAKAPATWAAIWVVRYRPFSTRERFRTGSRVVAVAVLSWPVPSCLPREAALGRLGQFDRAANLRFANRHIRTISRVIVHPQFRSLGLASRLIRWACEHCNTRYAESLAVMGRAHPMFERAGMTCVRLHDADSPADPHDASPVYFFYERKPRPRKLAARSPSVTLTTKQENAHV